MDTVEDWGRLVTIENIFTDYFNNNTWQGKESISGPGSDYEQTKYLIPELQNLIGKLGVKKIFDAPCGDFNWMKNIDMQGLSYTGADIVKPLIIKNNKRYKAKNISFVHFNLIKDNIPKSDLVIIRDCLVHLPNENIFDIIHNVKSSGSKYLLTTHFTWEKHKNNYDIKPGQWRRINLTQTPFYFPFPEYIIIEGNLQSYDHDKTMSLWKVSDLPDYGVVNG